MNIFRQFLNLIKLWVISILILSSSSQANLLNENKLNYKVDLLFGNFNDQHNYLLAGVKVKLDNNWKIYWKNPGEAGLPPKIIFDKISNVSNVNLLFPEPKSFKFFNILLTLIFCTGLLIISPMIAFSENSQIKITVF